jgi:hypothetical protein
MSPKGIYNAVPAACRRSWLAAMAVLLGVMAFAFVDLGTGPRLASATPDEGTGTIDMTKECVAADKRTLVTRVGDFRFVVVSKEHPYGIAQFTLACGGSQKVEGLQPGTYSVEETSKVAREKDSESEFVETANSCIKIAVEADKTTTCKIVNEKRQPAPPRGNLTVKKQCLAMNPATGKLAPLTGEGDFLFELLVGEPPFTSGLSAARTFVQVKLACGESRTVTGLQPGTYTVSETSSATKPDPTKDAFVEKSSSCIGVAIEENKTAKCEIVNEKTSGTPASSATPAAGAASSTSVTPPSTGDGGILGSGSWAQTLLWLGPLLALGTGGGGYLLARAFRRP